MNKAIKIILAFGLVSAILFFVVIPWIQTWIVSQPIWVYFIIFYFMIFALISLVLYFVISTKKKNLKGAFRVASSTTLIVMAIDLFLPAWAVDSQGNILTSETIGYFGSIDYVIATFWHNLGISGPWLMLFTYVITGMILLFIAFYIMGSKNFVSEMKRVMNIG